MNARWHVGWLLGIAVASSACARPASQFPFEVGTGGGPRLPLALRIVEGSLRLIAPVQVEGTPGLWMVDTGSTSHVLDYDRAKARGLLGPEGVTSTHYRWDGSLEIMPNTIPVALRVFADEDAPVATPISTMSWGDGLDGILSPQTLGRARGRAIAIDLRIPQLAVVPAATAVHVRDELARSGARLSACRNLVDIPLPLVHATVEGHDVELIVDTGSPISLLYADTLAGAEVAMRGTAYATDDGWFATPEMELVEDVDLAVAGARGRHRVAVVARSTTATQSVCHASGVVGLDVLRGCAIVMDETGGAIRCEAPARAQDSMPRLATFTRVPNPTLLSARAPRLPAGIAARIGCAVVTTAQVAAAARSLGIPDHDALARLVRERVLAYVGEAEHVRAPSREDVEAAITMVRLNNNLDEAALAAAIAKQGLTMAAYRASITQQLREGLLLNAVTAMGFRDPTAGIRQLTDRLARVGTIAGERGCELTWPRYYPSQLAFVGLTHADTVAARAMLGRRLEGKQLSLDASGTLPASLTEWLGEALGRRVQITIEDEGTTLRLRVAP